MVIEQCVVSVSSLALRDNLQPVSCATRWFHLQAPKNTHSPGRVYDSHQFPRILPYRNLQTWHPKFREVTYQLEMAPNYKIAVIQFRPMVSSTASLILTNGQ